MEQVFRIGGLGLLGFGIGLSIPLVPWYVTVISLVGMLSYIIYANWE